MATSELFKALMGDQYEYQPKESYTGALSYGIAKSLPEMVNPYGSTGSNLATVLGGSLLAGLFGYSAKKEAEQKNLAQANYMQELLSGGITPEREKEILAADPRLAKLTTGIKLQELLGGTAAKAESEAARQKAEIEIITDYAKKKNVSFEQAKQMLDQGYGASPSVPPVETPETDTSYEGKFKKLAQEGIDQLGLTPNAAADYARRILAPLELATKQVQQKAAKIRELNTAADEMISTATKGVEGAGMTGGPVYARSLREAASQAYGLFGVGAGAEEERRQIASQALLDSIKPKAVQALRSPGAVSDRETRMIVTAVPSSENTPEQNLKLLENMKQVTALNGEYADALETYATMGKGDQIEKLWNDYKKQEAFRNDKYNENRISFGSWLISRKGTAAAGKEKISVADMTDDELRAIASEGK